MSLIQGMPLYIIRVKDLDREIAFYRDGLGMTLTRHVEGRLAQFTIPTCGTLELLPGGEIVAPVHDRREVQHVAIYRVANVHGVVDRAVQHGATVVNAPFEFNENWLAYIADPEGHVFGLSTMMAA
ncbi:MAG: VOC family protein [Dehalococcoidia bacterium]